MKRLFIIGLLALVVISSGCTEADTEKDTTEAEKEEKRDVYKTVMEDDGVVCYTFREKDGFYPNTMSCLPIDETEVTP